MTPPRPAAEARALRERGDLHGVIARWGTLLDTPDSSRADADLLEEIARAFALLGDAPQSERAFERCCTVRPERAALYRCQVGWFYQRRKRWTRALDWYERALATFPGYHLCLFRVGYCLERLHRPLAATAALDRATAAWDASPPAQRERSRGIQVQVFFHLARCLRETGQADAAAGALDQCEALDGTGPAAVIKLEHRLTSRGEIHLHQGHHDQALDVLREALRLEPESAVICERLARALALAGHTDEAEEALRRATRLPRGHTLAPLVARWLRERGRLGEAAARIAEARTAASEPDASLLLEEALLQRDLGRPLAALDLLGILAAGRVPPESQLRAQVEAAMAHVHATRGDVARAKRILALVNVEGQALPEVASLREWLQRESPPAPPILGEDAALPPSMLAFGLTNASPRLYGTVTRWLAERGFGFIDTTEGEALFFHATACEPGDLAEIQVNSPVSYVPGQDSRTGKIRAERVRTETPLARARSAGA